MRSAVIGSPGARLLLSREALECDGDGVSPTHNQGVESDDDNPRLVRQPGRLISFSDAVFAIAVTLLVLEIQPPEDFRHLVRGLAALWPSYLGYALSFLLVGQVWVNHHVMFDRVRHVDRRVLFLNTVLLMVIAFLPFSTSLLADAIRADLGLRTAVVVYGATLWTAAALFNVIWAHLRRAGLLDPGLGSAGIRAIGRRFALALVWIGSGILVGAFVPIAGVVIIAGFLPAYYLPIRGEYGEEREAA
ncbi:TMEM175 family protein [Micromonospora sp. WMMD964]|uniref:TMEM175 family protein n=1 Tax=Micromonospora sp. WMMD964 TaxID=3016091 RepID=UPI00249C5A51|nr:TMEM175 family protein [Micromonospora sp. WMMD964]WFE98787.1 TMEM175 family protein [Micromonospora sp. WMMD964]